MNTPRRPLPGNNPPPPAPEPESEFADMLLDVLESAAASLHVIALAQSSLALLHAINFDDTSAEAEQARKSMRSLAFISAALAERLADTSDTSEESPT